MTSRRTGERSGIVTSTVGSMRSVSVTLWTQIVEPSIWFMFVGE